MLKTKEQKTYLITVLVLIVILGLISFWRKPQFKFVDTTNYAKLAERQKQQQSAYEKYLASLKVDPKASQELFQQLITKEDIRKEVETALQTNQPATPPKIDDKDLIIVQKRGQQAVVDYLTETVGPTVNFNRQTLGFNKEIFSGDATPADAVLSVQQDLMDKLTKAEVPTETVALHKALLSSLKAYQDLLQTSKDYAANPSLEPWPKVYQDYAAINLAAKTYKQEFQKLDIKYKLASLPPLHYAAAEKSNSPFIPNAQAIFGLGDLTITVGDIPALIWQAVQEGLTASFSQFMGSFIQKMVQKIESNYMIANFLFYSDALVTGQYVDDYLNKYVADNLDRRLVKKFIPQFNCGQQQDLKPVFQAKAAQYLGFNPDSVDPNDPDYYQKMARVGEFMASENGWRLYYQGLAAQAESEAEKAAERELTSPGYKTPRDTITNRISLSISGIVSAQRASLNAIMQLGISNADRFISNFVAQLTQTLMNNFVFRGATSTGGTAGVFKEQATCLAAAQVQVILPAANTVYVPPPPPPDDQQMLQEYCQKYPEACPPKTTPRGAEPGQ